MFIGAAIGIAASALPGMNLAAGSPWDRSHVRSHAALPLTSTLLAVLLLGVDVLL
jgi:hypothetical protein